MKLIVTRYTHTRTHRIAMCVFSQFFPRCFMHAQKNFTLDFRPLLLLFFQCVRCAHSLGECLCVCFFIFASLKAIHFLLLSFVRAVPVSVLCVRKFHLCPLLTRIDSLHISSWLVSRLLALQSLWSLVSSL